MKFKTSQLFGLIAFSLWLPIPWLYINPPGFLAGQPLAIYAVALFFGGVSLAATALWISFRTRVSERTARVYVFLFVLAFVGAYQFSGLAPSWQCFGKKLEATVGRAAGQNCTTTCTNNDKKPCSGWSSCWDKFVSCNSSGRDQDGRGCQGCCFSCEVVCEDPEPTNQPPTINGVVNCSQMGNYGWCVGDTMLVLTAYDPQGFALAISGTIDGSSFTCAAGSSCSIALPEGSGSITYEVTAPASGLSSSIGSTTWKRDITAPAVNALYPSVNGLNGWHISAPVAVSASGSDVLSGLASAQVSVNGGAWQTNASLMDGTYTINFRTIDNAGNTSTISRAIKVDSTPPTVNPVIPFPDGLNDWFVTAPVNVSARGSDTGSGLGSALVSVDGSTWQPNMSLSDGVYTIRFRSTDNAGNTVAVTRTVKVDASLPTIVTYISGTLGNSGWYVSQTTTTITADELSGIARIQYNPNGIGWQDGSSFVSNDGINQIYIKIYDVAGNVASGSVEIKVDTTPPAISTSVAGTKGLSSWYVSQATTSISATDENSGLDRIEYNQNSEGWREGTSVGSDDGVNTISIKAYDVAGNISTDSLDIKVDTISPVVIPVVPSPDGLNNWFIAAPVAVSANGSDAGSGLASAEVSVNGDKWETGGSLSDGVHAVDFKSIDYAGNSTTVSRTVKVDTVPPTLSTSIAGTAGRNGWYVSQTTTTISVRDETSGVDRIQYDQNRMEWKDGTSVVSQDGINDIDMRAYDLAGNMARGSIQVKVDTEKPVSQFISPGNGSTNTLARGSFALSGSSFDMTSGVTRAEISLDGKAWLPLVISPNNQWTYDWDTLSWGDGMYPIVVRTTDVAGNQESIESGAHITLLVNNVPPHIKLTPEWFIWQSGNLVIKTEYFPVRDGMIIIADKEGRWPAVRIPFGEKYPLKIKWDRRFANRVLAPAGNYRVTVSVCNVYDLCSEKSALIKIPWYAAPLSTGAAPTEMVEVEQEPRVQAEQPEAAKVTPADEISAADAETPVESQVDYETSVSLLSFIVLIAMMWAMSSAALADKRPVAIRAIAQILSSQKHKGEKGI